MTDKGVEMAGQLGREWAEGVLFCELRDYEVGGIEDTVIYGQFRIDEALDVQQKVGVGQRKLCDIMNVLGFVEAGQGAEDFFRKAVVQ